MQLNDADKLLECYEGLDKCHVPVGVVKANIEDMPTVEAEPVRHGRWIIDRAFGNDVLSGEQMVICSVCDKGIFWGKQNYCPNCGAKMDEVEE